MDKLSFSVEVEAYETYKSIKSDQLKELCKSAIASLNHAYAPYSDYLVGSAVLLDNNMIVEGSNQENAVFPLGLCAERVAIFSALTQYPNTPIDTVALVTAKKVPKDQLPGFPCGSCRQVISEMEDRFNKKVRIIVLAPDERAYVLESAKDLLPFSFKKSDVDQ